MVGRDTNDKAERKAFQLLQQAKKTGNKKLGFLPASSNSLEDRAELFSDAGNQFKIAQKWERAGEAFLEAANAYTKAKSGVIANQMFNNAANCFKQVPGGSDQAASCFERAAQAALDAGQFFKAAKLYKEIGEFYEKAGDNRKALDNYSEAANYYIAEGQEQNANSAKLKAAPLQALEGQPLLSIQTFEEVARSSADNNLTKYSARGYLMRALIVALTIPDVELATSNLSEYRELDPNLPGSREDQLMEKLVQAAQEEDEEGWAQACADHDARARLDRWMTTMLLRGKEKIESGGMADDSLPAAQPAHELGEGDEDEEFVNDDVL